MIDLSLMSKYLEDDAEERAPAQAIQDLFVIPLSNIVLLPGTVLPLHIVEPYHQKLIDGILASGSDTVVCFAPLGRDNQMMLSSVCGAGHLVVVDEYPDGRKNVIVEGNYRVEILSFLQDDPIFQARARWLPDLAYRKPERMPKQHRDFLSLVKQWLFLMGHEGMEYAPVLDLFRAPHHLADFIAGYFLPDYTLKQKLLETTDCEARVLLVEAILKKAVGWFEQGIPPLAAERPTGSLVH